MSSLKVIFTFGLFLLILTSNSGVFSQNRIIGGTRTNILKFPFLIVVSIYNGGNNYATCGASIISKDWAVTAAHCFISLDRSQITKSGALSGTSYIKEMIPLNKKAPKYHKMTECHVHEEFKGEENYDGFDIAVFKVDPPFDFDERTQPAILPKKNQNITAKHGQITGWGCTELSGPTNPKLLYANLTKVDTDTCLKSYPQPIKHKKSVLCYGTEKNRKISNVCMGDSGGPLVINDKMVAGIVSSFMPDLRIPALFSSTAYFRNWIKEKTGV